METASEDLFGAEASRGYVEDILEAMTSVEPQYTRAVAFGVEWHASGADLGALAREIGRLGRLVEDVIEKQGVTGRDERRRAREVMDEAAAQALEAFASAARGRRDRWLSYYSHEMRNALNTLVNAHWILRNSEGKNTTRVFDMTERAVRRLESSVKELRDLETQVTQPAPGRPDKAGVT